MTEPLRNRRPARPKLSDTAKACREAQDEIGRFYAWTGSSDARMGNAWRQQVTDSVLAGSTVAEAVGLVKDEWIARCRRERVKPRAERTPDDVAILLQQVVEHVHHGATPTTAAGMYRRIAQDYPAEAGWLVQWAALWESWGDVWQVMPSGGAA